MQRALKTIPTLMLIIALLFSLGCSSDQTSDAPVSSKEVVKKRYIAFGGGPTGGTFNFFANKMASIISSKYTWLDVSPKGSGGSAENLRNLNLNGVDIAIVYSGDAFLGRNGKLPNDDTRYDKVRAVSFLYGAPAQLVVRKDSGIKSSFDLIGKKVAIGNPGSGAALSAERFFRHLKIWDKIDHRKQGYSQAAADFIAKKIDAFWVLVGYPNSSVIEAASHTPIALVDLHADATNSDFYDLYPFYSMIQIPANTYTDQDTIITTFQDASLWCASEKLAPKIIYDCLSAVYAEQGLKDMVTAHKAAKTMSIANGIKGASIPLHPGAIQFWREQGLEIPSKLLQ